MHSPYTPQSRKAQIAEWSLIYSGRVIATVLPDTVWPRMYRIHWRDGRVSDFANLTRCRDAAEVIASNGGRDQRWFNWKCPCGRTAGPPVRWLDGLQS
jgi:hypothetical protein